MELAAELERALAVVCASGPSEVHENGEWLALFDGFQYEVRRQGDTTLLHLWSAKQSLVRRVLGITEESDERILIEVARLGHARPARLEVIAPPALKPPRRIGREQFSDNLRRLLADRFPDELVDSMATAADLHHSLSGSYARGTMHRGSDGHAILAAAPAEDAATIDGILTFGLIWLDRVRGRARNRRIAGLRLFLPRGASAVTAHRLASLAAPADVELYEYDPLYWRVHRVPLSDAGNLATWIEPRREMDAALAAAPPEAEGIRRLAPDAIRLGVAAISREVTLRFRGLEFARGRQGILWFGLGDNLEMLTPRNAPALEKLVAQLDAHRHPLASETNHRFYRAQPERWLETLIAADPTRIDARLDPRYIYTQVPAFSSSNRGIIDMLGVTREGRLAVLELKAAEDMQLVMQAVDYWLRVRWHHDQDDFRRYGYFPDVALQKEPPLLFLVAPGFHFHPSSEILLRYLSPEIEVARVGLNENWRQGVRVIFRQ